VRAARLASSGKRISGNLGDSHGKTTVVRYVRGDCAGALYSLGPWLAGIFSGVAPFQLEPDHCPLARFAFDRDATVVDVNNSLSERES
jgi:hypothetical protein